MPALKRIPATIITGFLGAGKTTLIRHLLQTADGRRLALIINEFGDIGVDGEILKSCGAAACRAEDVIELANGCICCTVADDFVPTMTRLIERENPPEHIVIETSGLALPQPLVRAFNWPEIKARVTVDGVVTVVDGKALSEGRFSGDDAALSAQRANDPSLAHDDPISELFEDQLACADLVILNKADLLGDDESARLKARLAPQLRNGAKLIACAHGALDAAALLGLSARAEADMAHRLSHHELEGQAHDHDDFETFLVPMGEAADRQSLIARIRAVVAAHDILRLKGFVAVKGAAARLTVQAVGPRLDSYFDRPWAAGERPATGLVVIGLKGLDRAAIALALMG